MAGLLCRFALERDRWILWTPVALAAGIAVYFSLDGEPEPWWGLAACLVAASLLAWRRGACGWPLCLGLLLAALGFVAAELRSAAVAAPILRQPTGMVRLQGRIVAIEPVEGGQRLILDRLTGGPLERLGIERIRVHVRMVAPLKAGGRVQLRASLAPPPPPMLPGGYDFGRQAWFQRIGAVGFAVGRPWKLPQLTPPTRRERLQIALARARQQLGDRIVAAIDGAGYPTGIGSVAAALITGQRGPVPPAVLQAYRDAGLAHILVIAGMHLSMVAGLVLVGLRAGLALWPWAALRLPCHKLAAAGALLVTVAYLLIAGAPVPTQRAFVMNACLLLALLLDRQPLSLRAIGLAASLVLLTQPEALLSASFQLSFAAVYGLIAGYEALAAPLAAWRRSARAPWQTGLLYACGVLLTTQIAGTATAFYSLFHFGRYAVYSLLGNALAVPLVGFWVMPSALAAVCLLPFGLDSYGWQAMAAGLSWVGRIAAWVSALPGATLLAAPMPALALALFSAGAAWLVLWRRAWRLFGLAPMAAAIALALARTPPDLLLAGSLKLAALREADGRLHQSWGRGESGLRQAWARFDGVEPPMPWFTAGNGLDCDEAGCWVRLGERRWRVPLDRGAMAARGTHLIWLHDQGPPTIVTVADWRGRRPWVR